MLSNTLIDIENSLPDTNNDFLENDISINIIENISKKILSHKNTRDKENKTKEETISYEGFWKGNINLKNFKIFQLKAFAKSNRLYVTGTKKILMERIHNHFIKISSAIKIQRVFRGSIIRFSFKIRGPAFKNRKLCVNESDGFTLEPLSEIPFERFFSYTDSNNFIYGFDVISLISLYKNKNKIINPYTRERIDINLTNNILSLGKIIKIAFSYVLEDAEIEAPRITPPTTINRRVLNNNVGLEIRNNNVLTPNYETIVENNILTPEQRIILQRVQEIRQESLDRRIQNLFVEIDSLGNYTDSSWFSTLNRRNYIRFYRCLYDIWNFRAQMPMEIKRQICQFRDPFSQIRNFNLIGLTDDGLKQVCLSVMEEMVYTGIDNESKKLGTLHVLSALTIVSFPARNSMLWLYESVIY
jgi:hypothetical protein